MTYLHAFLAGGGICVIGQLLLDMTKLTAPKVLVIFRALDILLQRALWRALRGDFWAL